MITINNILSKETAVSVIGLGYVGLPIAIAFAKKISVVGFDTNSGKINDCINGLDYTGEVDPQDLKESTVKFTDNADELKNASFHIVAVPTPVNNNHNPDLSYLISACELLGPRLKQGAVVVFESTVYPGVTEDVCVPALEEKSGLVCGKDFFVGYSPERINPGDKDNRLETIVKVVAGMDEATLELVAQVYELVVDAGVYRASSIKVAEAAKVIENSQRDINIAFVNELAVLFKRMDIDTLEVLKAASTKWNFLAFAPGLVGGHCIGVDPYYLTYRAQQLGYHPQVILAGRRINDHMGRFVAESTVKQLIRKHANITNCNVAILGFAFKENCPDIRNTRVIDIVDELNEYGITPVICDPVASADEAREHYSMEFVPLETIRNMCCVIIAVAHDEFKALDLGNLLAPEGLVVDVKGVYDLATAKSKGLDYWRL